MDLARARTGARALLVRPRAPVRRGPAPRHRDRRRCGRFRARARSRRRALRRHRADERQDDHDRDARRARRQPDASRLDRSRARRDRGGGSRRRHSRPQRHRGVRRAVRAPRHSHCGRRAGLPRPARLSPRARASAAGVAAGRAARAAGSARAGGVAGDATCSVRRTRAARGRGAVRSAGRTGGHDECGRHTGDSPDGPAFARGQCRSGRNGLVARRRRPPWNRPLCAASNRTPPGRAGTDRRGPFHAAAALCAGGSPLAVAEAPRGASCARACEAAAGRPDRDDAARRSPGACRVARSPAGGAPRGALCGAHRRRRGGNRGRSYDQWPVSDRLGSTH
jgi:hypothetical protein